MNVEVKVKVKMKVKKTGYDEISKGESYKSKSHPELIEQVASPCKWEPYFTN